MNIEIDRIIAVISLFAKKGQSISFDSLLLEDGLIDSLNVVQITLELERQFGKSIPVMEVTINDLETPTTLQKALVRVWS